MKQRLRDTLTANSEFIHYIGILDNEGNEVTGVAQQSLKESIKDKTYQFVFKTVKSNFQKTCAETLKSVFIQYERYVIRLAGLPKEHVLFILFDKEFQNISMLLDIEMSVKSEYDQLVAAGEGGTR